VNEAQSQRPGHQLAADTVVLAVGTAPNQTLAAELVGLDGLEISLIGDAAEPCTAAEAIRDGFEIAYAI